MKNIQVIDGARNCTFSIFQATEDDFKLIFPDEGQDIQYIEDVKDLPNQDAIADVLSRLWQRPIRKRDALGIHGTLFCALERYKQFYRTKREDSIDPLSINAAQRRLFSSHDG